MSMTLGGKRPDEFGLKVKIDTQEPAFPEIRNYTMTIPGRHGALDFGGDLGPRPFEISCSIIGKTQSEVQANIRRLAAHLIDGDGRPKVLSMEFDYEPGKVYSVRLTSSVPVERLAALGNFKLPLTAYDPFAYSPSEVDDIILDSDAVILDSDVKLSFEGVYTFEGITAWTQETVGNFGSMNVMPEIEVSGEFTTLNISANGNTFSYNKAMAPGGVLNINGGDFTVTENGVNTIEESNGVFLKLLVGTNTVNIGGTGLNCTVSFIFKSKYI